MAAVHHNGGPLEEVLDKTDSVIARLYTRAFVTSGYFAALVLGVAGIMTGGKLVEVGDADRAKGDRTSPRKRHSGAGASEFYPVGMKMWLPLRSGCAQA